VTEKSKASGYLSLTPHLFPEVPGLGSALAVEASIVDPTAGSLVARNSYNASSFASLQNSLINWLNDCRLSQMGSK
jgi:hypothetical protein